MKFQLSSRQEVILRLDEEIGRLQKKYDFKILNMWSEEDRMRFYQLNKKLKDITQSQQ
jgi:DNA-binding HxlR family transcriptional regulator